MVATVYSPEPPLHLVLGKLAIEIVCKKLDSLNRDFDTWEATTLGAESPS
jgi:hypothetical protein